MEIDLTRRGTASRRGNGRRGGGKHTTATSTMVIIRENRTIPGIRI